MIKIPILTYHALHAPGWEYWTNDHVALETDLQLIKQLGFEVVSLVEIVDFLKNNKPWPTKPVIGLSFDDATDHDFKDWSHPAYGYLKSFYTLIKEATTEGFNPKATSFVIASAKARAILDKTCIAGRKQWNDDWWLNAAQSGILDIGNHSWDHTHVNLDIVANADQIKGRFDQINNLNDANLQIQQAETYIRSVIGDLSSRLFAYPYGDHNNYLIDEYFPTNKMLNAAFITGGEYVTPESNIWKIPRFVCGENWKRPEELEKILTMSYP
ncbi:MAG: polysaccharide deacetylase family protein [Marinicellaceae bacterium]